VAANAYVPAEQCRSCHQAEWAAWKGSHHDHAIDLPTEDTVLGDFSGVEFEADGLWARFIRDGEQYRVETRTGDGPVESYVVRYTFGVEPLQQILLELDRGRLQAFTIAWDTEKKRWFHIYAGERFEADDPFHWSGRYQNWNTMCADCHSTELHKNYDEATDSFSTTFEDIDVGCQSCHGPGARHVAWADAGAEGDDPWVGLAGPVSAAEQLDACAPCHSRRSRVSPHPVPGAAFTDQYLPATLREGLYFADGQILEEVYVYGSFVQSKMHAAGVRCSDCHDPHALTPVLEEDQLCTRCHSLTPPDRFAALEAQAKRYDDPSHHHHPVESEGARCVSCHMLDRVYMGNDPRRDHSFRIPRPDLTVAIGTPNACDDCHAERGPEWAEATVAKWFPGERPSHFATVFAAARAGDAEARDDLARIVRNDGEPAIVRATALELLTGFGGAALGPARDVLGDPSPLVRVYAVQAFARLPAASKIDTLAQSLSDRRRAVRQAAAQALADVPPSQLSREQLAARSAGLNELRTRHRAESDLPDGPFNRAVLAEAEGKRSEAVVLYSRALDLDPTFLPATFNLSNLLNRIGANPEAHLVLTAGLDHSPDNGDLYYSRGLLRAEMGRVELALDDLLQAGRRLPRRPRVHYNGGLLLQQLGRLEHAETSLRRAVELRPDTPDFVYALALNLAQQGRWSDAANWARALAQLLPNDPAPLRMAEDFDRRALH
jgi:tetratricopeptide (TPR) repeat protein